jgi:heme/copper-type cytochrome/quinol oxidase subunit 2
MEGIINLHHDLMFFIVFISFFVAVVVYRTIFYFANYENLNSNSRAVVHGTTIEII